MQVEVAEPLSKLGLEFPDIYLGKKSLTCLILFNCTSIQTYVSQSSSQGVTGNLDKVLSSSA